MTSRAIDPSTCGGCTCARSCSRISVVALSLRYLGHTTTDFQKRPTLLCHIILLKYHVKSQPRTSKWHNTSVAENGGHNTYLIGRVRGRRQIVLHHSLVVVDLEPGDAHRVKAADEMHGEGDWAWARARRSEQARITTVWRPWTSTDERLRLEIHVAGMISDAARQGRKARRGDRLTGQTLRLCYREIAL